MDVDPLSAPCSELPNDNPALHSGTVWVPLTPTGRPRAVSRAPAEVATPVPPAAPVRDAAPPSAEAPEPFRQLVELLARVALSAGATRAAALLPAFLDGQRVELGEVTSRALVESGHAEPAAGGVTISASASATAGAWRAVLNGESEDLSTCEDTLDAWCAELVAVVAGTPARANELRRELRRFGVAAFGLLAA